MAMDKPKKRLYAIINDLQYNLRREADRLRDVDIPQMTVEQLRESLLQNKELMLRMEMEVEELRKHFPKKERPG